jgi:hypothetical protein
MSHELISPKKLAFEAELRMYVALGMSSTEIARTTGRNIKIVYAALHRLGVPMRKRSKRIKPSSQSTKMRLLQLLQDYILNRPNTSVSLSELAQTLGVSRERIRQLYRHLARENVLPPVQHSGRSRIGEWNKKQVITRLKRQGETSRKLTKPKTPALEVEVRTYSEQGMTAHEIARVNGKPVYTTYSVPHRLDIPFKRAKRGGGRSETLALEAEVWKYSQQGLTAPEIVRRTGRYKQTIYAVLHRLGIFNGAVYGSREPLTPELEAKVRAYSEQGMPVTEIVKRTGLDVRTIHRVHHRLHIPLPPSIKYLQAHALEAEVRAYSEQGMIAPEIAKKIGRPLDTIYAVLHRLNIPLSKPRRRSG